MPCAFNPNSDMQRGARPPRALFSAPSRKTWVHKYFPSVRVSFTRKMLAARARPATPGAGVLPSSGVRVNRDTSTDGDQGNAPVLVVTGDPHRLGIEGHLPVGDIDVAMMAVAQIHTERPVAVGSPLHGVRVRVP